MENCCASYVKQVGRELELPRQRKRALLIGFRTELEERFPGEVCPEEILIQVGTPAAAACALLESVPPEERERYRARKRRWIHHAVAALTVLLAVSVGMVLYLDATEVKRVKTTITVDSVPVDYSHDSGGLDYSDPVKGN